MHLTSHRVAANVRAEMARVGARREDVAAAAGLSYDAFGRRLRGNVPFNVDELAGIAGLLGTTAHALLGDEVAA